MKCWVNNLKKYFQILYLLHCFPLGFSSFNPGLFRLCCSCINFAVNKCVSERLYDSMENYINKRLEEAENKPPIYHLDVGSSW